MVVLVACFAPMSSLAESQGQSSPQEFQPQGLNHVGVYALRELEPALTGLGIRFGIVCRSITYTNGEPQNDYRPYAEHKCFRPGQFTFHDSGDPSPGISPHSTAACSILLGEDPSAFNAQLGPFCYQGAAPSATADVYELWYFLTSSVFPQLAVDADVVTADFGQQFEDWWTRGIESLVEHRGLIVVAGIGNGSDSCDPPLYPGAAANVIGVGVVDSVNTEDLATNLSHFALAYPQHSSFGPTADARCKPDIVAPGNCLAAGASDAELYELTGDWSSFSTPVTAGAIGLLVQKAKAEPRLNLAVSPRGGNCVIRAIMMNSATKLPFWHKGELSPDDDHLVPLDYVQGAGMLDVVNAYEHLIAGRNRPGDVPNTGWDNNRAVRDDTVDSIYRIDVSEPKDKLITATLAWNRHYRDVYPFERDYAKDCNLRLELWATDPSRGGEDILLDYSDSSVDNVEHICCQALQDYDSYEIVVCFSDSAEPRGTAISERYGLVWNVCPQGSQDSIFWRDLNADGIVNALDLAVLLDNLGASVDSPNSYLFGDVNTDGAIDMRDVQIMLDDIRRRADWHRHGDSPSE
jgi:hypothetical protein